MNREEKAEAISELEAAIGKATNAFLIDFKGITVPQVTELRKQVRETSSGYIVVLPCGASSTPLRRAKSCIHCRLCASAERRRTAMGYGRSSSSRCQPRSAMRSPATGAAATG